MCILVVGCGVMITSCKSLSSTLFRLVILGTESDNLILSEINNRTYSIPMQVCIGFQPVY